MKVCGWMDGVYLAGGRAHGVGWLCLGVRGDRRGRQMAGVDNLIQFD